MMDVAAWRQSKRAELYAARKAMTAEQRHEATRAIARELDDRCRRHRPTRVGLYWPIKYEPNLLSWARARSQSLYFCLPVVVSQGHPLEYWHWTPGDPMQSGVWEIQVPARRNVVTPDLIIAPLLGLTATDIGWATAAAIRPNPCDAYGPPFCNWCRLRDLRAGNDLSPTA